MVYNYYLPWRQLLMYRFVFTFESITRYKKQLVLIESLIKFSSIIFNQARFSLTRCSSIVYKKARIVFFQIKKFRIQMVKSKSIILQSSRQFLVFSCKLFNILLSFLKGINILFLQLVMTISRVSFLFP